MCIAFFRKHFSAASRDLVEKKRFISPTSLGDGGDPVAIGIIRAKENTVFTKSIKDLIKPGSQPLIISRFCRILPFRS